MSYIPDDRKVIHDRREQMLKLVTKGFYNELINYGVQKGEILRAASHLLDNVISQELRPQPGPEYYSQLFSVDAVKTRLETHGELGVRDVVLHPLNASHVAQLLEWLRNPLIGETLVPPFPDEAGALAEQLLRASCTFFAIYYQGTHVGLVGGEHIDRQSGTLEMKKFVGQPGMHGKGIGKAATFAFLYHAFQIAGVHKVFTYSRDINIRNINLNSRLGFELEGIFLENLRVGDRRYDVVRMALLRPLWLQIFSAPA
jgi:RimJ/RimL family protein N-acetyltransferase